MFNEYPYVNLQDVNLDWILKHIKDLETNLQDFVKLNTIKYADPIIWNITKQYETNTVVIDGNTGTAYISVQPVPAGVALTNTDYWTVIFTLNLTTSNQNITFRDDGTNVVATFASDTGDWILWNFYLYRVTQPISVNTAYVEGFNIERFSVELFIKDYINTLTGIIGDLDDLTTSDKTSIVEAINSLLSDINDTIGNLDDLPTSDKTSIVNAIIELANDISDINTDIGVLNDLNTTDKTSLVNAVNETISYINMVNCPTVADMLMIDAQAGDHITTLGYLSPGDRGAALYDISATSNAYSITLNNGLYANIISKGGITPQMFGVMDNEPSSTAQSKWDLYVDYVNNTDYCYFLLPEATYNVRKGFIIDKNMIGENNQAVIAADATIVDNFDDVKVTTSGIPYAINGLLAVGNVKSYFRLENIQLDCGFHCDYGLFIPEVNKSYFSNIRISQCNLDGLTTVKCWMSKFDIINVFQAKRNSFNFGYPTAVIMVNGGVMTSCDFSDLYVQGFTSDYNPVNAYAIYGVSYSTFKSLACDGYEPQNYIYNIINTHGTSFIDIGFEACGDANTEMIRIAADTHISFNGLTVLGCTSSRLFLIASDGTVNIDNIYMNNCTNTYVIDIRNTATGDYNFTYGADITGTFRNSSGNVSYLLSTPTQLQKMANGSAHNLI